MSRVRHDGSALGPFDVLEEAAHLLRTVPASAHAAYLVGTVPFLLGALFAVAHMTQGLYAGRYAGEVALGLTVGFVWMKAWQAVAAERALAWLEDRAPAWPRGLPGWMSFVFRVVRLQGSALVFVPGWSFAWGQLATVLTLSEDGGVGRAAFRHAWWGWRSGMSIRGILTVLGVVVWLNLSATIYVVPFLVRTLLGLEDVVTTTGWNPFNTTFFAAGLALAYLAIDPFAKAAHVVRCFHGRARRTGLDLVLMAREAMRRVRLGTIVAGVALLFLGLAGGSTVHAAADEADDDTPLESVESGGPAEEASLVPGQLDQALDQVIEETGFSWRHPRDVARADGIENKGLIERFADSVAAAVKRFGDWLGRLLRRFFEWLFENRREETDDRASRHVGGVGLGGLSNGVMLVLVVVLVAAVVWLIVSLRGPGEKPKSPDAVVPIAVALEEEHVTADQLPEDEWMRLARELMARGEMRLALRALFLGTLAGLAGRGLLVLARHKSNRDYERELVRRGSAVGAVTRAFAENRRFFERVWYGRSVAGDEEVRRYEDNLKQMLGGAL